MEIDLMVMISGWLAALGIAVYALSSGKVSWNMFMAFLEELANDPSVMKKMFEVYSENARARLPASIVKMLDDWFKEKGYEMPEEEPKKKKPKKGQSAKKKKKEKKEESKENSEEKKDEESEEKEEEKPKEKSEEIKEEKSKKDDIEKDDIVDSILDDKEESK